MNNSSTIAVVGPFGAGKSALIGLLAELYTLQKEKVVLDCYKEETFRRLTVFAKPVPLWIDNRLVTLIDVPGKCDFFGNTLRVLRILENVLLVVDPSQQHSLYLEKLATVTHPRKLVFSQIDKFVLELQLQPTALFQLLQEKTVQLAELFATEFDDVYISSSVLGLLLRLDSLAVVESVYRTVAVFVNAEDDTQLRTELLAQFNRSMCFPKGGSESIAQRIERGVRTLFVPDPQLFCFKTNFVSRLRLFSVLPPFSYSIRSGPNFFLLSFLVEGTHTKELKAFFFSKVAETLNFAIEPFLLSKELFLMFSSGFVALELNKPCKDFSFVLTLKVDKSVFARLSKVRTQKSLFRLTVDVKREDDVLEQSLRSLSCVFPDSKVFYDTNKFLVVNLVSELQANYFFYLLKLFNSGNAFIVAQPFVELRESVDVATSSVKGRAGSFWLTATVTKRRGKSRLVICEELPIKSALEKAFTECFSNGPLLGEKVVGVELSIDTFEKVSVPSVVSAEVLAYELRQFCITCIEKAEPVLVQPLLTVELKFTDKPVICQKIKRIFKRLLSWQKQNGSVLVRALLPLMDFCGVETEMFELANLDFFFADWEPVPGNAKQRSGLAGEIYTKLKNKRFFD